MVSDKNIAEGAVLIILVIVSVLFISRIHAESLTPTAAATGNVILVVPPCQPLNLTATLNPDNKSVDLNWTSPSCPFDNFTVYYDTNVSAMENLNFSTATQNVTLSNTTLNWTDWNANVVQQRYYRVAVKLGNITGGANKTAGKFDFEFINNSPKTIALPLEPVNRSLINLIRPAQDYDAVTPDNIRVFYGINQQKVAAWYGPTWGWWNLQNWADLELEPNVGYYIYPINNSYNTTIVGLVPEKTNTTFSFANDSPKTIGIYQPYYYNLTESLHPAQDYDAVTPDNIRVFYGINQQKVAAWYGPTWKWWNLQNWNNLMLEPGAGYYLYPINNSYNNTINMSDGVII